MAASCAHARTVRCALHLIKNYALTAKVVLALLTTQSHAFALQQLDRSLESILTTSKTPCFINNRWSDCSILFGYYIDANRKLLSDLQLVNSYKQLPDLHNAGFTCSKPNLCSVTAPMRLSNEVTSNSLRPPDLTLKAVIPTEVVLHKDRNEVLFQNKDCECSHVDHEEKFLRTSLTTGTTENKQEQELNVKTKPVDKVIADASQVGDYPLAVSTVNSAPLKEDEATSTVDSAKLELSSEYQLRSITDSTNDPVESSTPVNHSPEMSTASLGEASYKVASLDKGNLSTTSPITEDEGHSNAPSISEFSTSNYSVEDSQPAVTSQLKNETLLTLFKESLDRMERKFLLSTFNKLTTISSEERRVNGISFLQSGFLLYPLLVSLSTEVDVTAAREIEDCLGLHASNEDKIEMLKQMISQLPESSGDLKFFWSSRLVLGRSLRAGPLLRHAAAATGLALSQLDTDDPATIAKQLNHMLESDSGGAMRDTFEEAEVSRGACGAALGALHARARWRAAPTLLDGTRAFRDAAARRAARYFRVNDRVRYAHLRDWDAEAIEIPYATVGLSLLVVVPRQPALRPLVEQLARAGLEPILQRVRPLRAAVTLPLYTLRMTLLLPNKLHQMGMPSLVDVNNTDCGSLKLSHAVQRLMFWSEAGRNAYKDDGIEWDPRPDVEVMVDRPYMFFVRWNNVTLMNGNFVL